METAARAARAFLPSREAAPPVNGTMPVGVVWTLPVPVAVVAVVELA